MEFIQLIAELTDTKAKILVSDAKVAELNGQIEAGKAEITDLKTKLDAAIADKPTGPEPEISKQHLVRCAMSPRRFWSPPARWTPRPRISTLPPVWRRSPKLPHLLPPNFCWRQEQGSYR